MVNVEDLSPATLPGSGPPDLRGVVIPVPFGTISTDQLVLSRPCMLMGWSLRESTGLGGAVLEIISGGSAQGELVASIDLTGGTDAAASQTQAGQTATGANAALAPAITPGAGQTAFITSLRIEGTGATAATVVAATLTGVLGGTITYEVTVPAGAAVAITPVTDQFGGRGLAANAAGVAITLNVPAFGAGNLFAEASVRGYVTTSAGVSDTQWLNGKGLWCRSGVFLHPVSGSVRGTMWVLI